MNKDKCDYCNQWKIGCRGYTNQILCPECMSMVIHFESKKHFEKKASAIITQNDLSKDAEQLNIFQFMRK